MLQSVRLEIARVDEFEHHGRLLLVQHHTKDLDDSVMAKGHECNGFVKDSVVADLLQRPLEHDLYIRACRQSKLQRSARRTSVPM